jgi:hypothetical protein
MKITREQITEMIKEAMGAMGHMDVPMAMDMHSDLPPAARGGFVHKDSVSRRDCCAAVMCLVECCSCPVTREMLMACCEDLMSGRHDR